MFIGSDTFNRPWQLPYSGNRRLRDLGDNVVTAAGRRSGAQESQNCGSDEATTSGGHINMRAHRVAQMASLVTTIIATVP